MNNTSSHHVAMTAAALLGSFVLAGPAQAQEEECDPSDCTITITVNNCQATGGITVDPEVVVVRSRRHMHWVIVPQGYEFASNGIEFRNPHPQFGRRDSPRPHEFHIDNDKSEAGYFYYYVNVKEVNGQSCTRVDPTIHNTN
jgi:hypothetical protein